MRKVLFIVAILSLAHCVLAQKLSSKLHKAYQQFENDEQLKHAISSFYVIDAKTGKVVFDKNSKVGLAPASTQKIITSATAFELLGKEYRYKTEFGTIENNERILKLFINPSGDPTFGSWRWEFTKIHNVTNNIINALREIDLKNYAGILMNAKGWDAEQIPDGWIWQDIGNYYGAGADVLNWRENQYDLILKSGTRIGDPVKIVETEPKLYSYNITSRVVSAAKGTGDNAYIYVPDGNRWAIVRGTIPVNEDRFRISGSVLNPAHQFIKTLEDSLKTRFSWNSNSTEITLVPLPRPPRIEYTHYSPSLDSIIYWFNKRSINLYGEALVKTFAFEKQGFGRTDSGVAILKRFWKEKGIEEDELNMYDGSGLSPLNRVTTHVQVEILKYAKTRDWFPYFFNSLPEFNGMKIKSGTISDVKGFTGYHTARDGQEYIFSFLVNNYTGSASSLVNKMYKVLDVLK
jgi:serine-type D-Ala-D-Ala carboxypeptidase/endopeptidase (penicillin-binding protein 4)